MSDLKAGNPVPTPPGVPGQGYQVVQLANGAFSVRSLRHRETFHPVVGPAAEAEALYVRQLRIRDRFLASGGDFVVWDVGLGAAANPVVLLRGLHGLTGTIRILSFDLTTEPLAVALENMAKLPYLAGFEAPLSTLVQHGEIAFEAAPGLQVHWTLALGDFPSLLNEPQAAAWPKPHAILFDAFSPATNTAMWTLPLFTRLFHLLDPARPCALPTYSRSTLLRVTLLLAGFFVGVGHATGEKEETTIAANALTLLEEPLGPRWLQRARNSTSAEPLREPVYRQAPLSAESWEMLRHHPQFQVPAVEQPR